MDAAQTAGHVPIEFHEAGIDLLACPGHKGLLGPLGTGVLVIASQVAEQMRTTREGGTGSASERAEQPEALPGRFEGGSHNAVGIAGLLASVRWILNRGLQTLREHEISVCESMSEGLDAIDGLRWFGPRTAAERVAVFCVRIDGLEPSEVSAMLETRFNIVSRSGLHCAPLAHRTVGTLADSGTMRLSAGPFISVRDVAAVADALSQIAVEVHRGRGVGFCQL